MVCLRVAPTKSAFRKLRCKAPKKLLWWMKIARRVAIFSGGMKEEREGGEASEGEKKTEGRSAHRLSGRARHRGVRAADHARRRQHEGGWMYQVPTTSHFFPRLPRAEMARQRKRQCAPSRQCTIQHTPTAGQHTTASWPSTHHYSTYGNGALATGSPGHDSGRSVSCVGKFSPILVGRLLFTALFAEIC